MPVKIKSPTLNVKNCDTKAIIFSGEKIIIDATNLNRARRTALYKRVKLLAPICRVFAIVFPNPPLPELVRRVTHRGIHDVPAAGLAAQLAAFEAPEQFVDCDYVIHF